MPCKNFTLLFSSAQGGDREAENAVYRVAFHNLRGTAAALLRDEGPQITLQPTALVGELFLKIRDLDRRVFSREHFFRLARRAMKQVLVDRGRGKRTQKRTFIEEAPRALVGADLDLERSVFARQVFERLRSYDALAAETVWLREVEGFTLEEAARLQRRSMWRVRTDYRFGVTWMAKRLNA